MLSIRSGVQPYLRPILGCLVGNPCSQGVSPAGWSQEPPLSWAWATSVLCHSVLHRPTSLQPQSRSAHLSLSSTSWSSQDSPHTSAGTHFLATPSKHHSGVSPRRFPGAWLFRDNWTSVPDAAGSRAPRALEGPGALSPREKMEHRLTGSHSLALERLLPTTRKPQPSPAPPQGALCLSPPMQNYEVQTSIGETAPAPLNSSLTTCHREARQLAPSWARS